ncbi:MAG: Spy/CpxP family protein refolding chaperone, partial [Pirellula sp.]
ARQEGRVKMQALVEKSESKLEDILDPKQLDRILGLLVQRDGMQALQTKLIQAKLKITTEQGTKLEELRKAGEEAAMSMFSRGGGGGGGTPGAGGAEAMRERMEKFTAARKENEEKMSAVLTDEQKKTMEEMKGPKFEFPAPQFGPGGPGGRGRGGNGN